MITTITNPNSKTWVFTINNNQTLQVYYNLVERSLYAVVNYYSRYTINKYLSYMAFKKALSNLLDMVGETSQKQAIIAALLKEIKGHKIA